MQAGKNADVYPALFGLLKLGRIWLKSVLFARLAEIVFIVFPGVFNYLVPGQ